MEDIYTLEIGKYMINHYNDYLPESIAYNNNIHIHNHTRNSNKVGLCHSKVQLFVNTDLLIYFLLFFYISVLCNASCNIYNIFWKISKLGHSTHEFQRQKKRACNQQLLAIHTHFQRYLWNSHLWLIQVGHSLEVLFNTVQYCQQLA